MGKERSKHEDHSYQGAYRDHLATIDEKGSRVWVYARKPKGRLTTYRNILGYFLIFLFFAIPFFKVNGEPFLLLDVIQRKIIIFGVQFWPQDFHLFFLAMISMIVFIILFTVSFGRLWCGWTCPQTVFMEVIYRPIEYLIEGDAGKQRQLSKQAWNFDKIWRKTLKHLLFFFISFITISTFLAYIVGIDALRDMLHEGPRHNLFVTTGVLIFSGIHYFIFSWFREQVCTIVCPYGRLQGVLLDGNSIVITYDYIRGEDRAPFRKSENRQAARKGDCIMCNMCVQVCPTGIDIRNGTQLECINCACCIDACNSVMEKAGLPKGLIRYSSEKIIAEGKKLKFNARIIAYLFILIILLGVTTYFLTSRAEIEATVLRAPGMLYQEQEEGKYSNLYNIKLINKTNEDLPINIKLLSHQGEIKIIGKEIMVEAQSAGESVFFIILDDNTVFKERMEIEIGVYSGERLIDETKTTFVGPLK